MLPNRPRSSRSKKLCICMEESVFPGKRSILNGESISGRIIPYEFILGLKLSTQVWTRRAIIRPEINSFCRIGRNSANEPFPKKKSSIQIHSFLLLERPAWVGSIWRCPNRAVTLLQLFLARSPRSDPQQVRTKFLRKRIPLPPYGVYFIFP